MSFKRKGLLLSPMPSYLHGRFAFTIFCLLVRTRPYKNALFLHNIYLQKYLPYNTEWAMDKNRAFLFLKMKTKLHGTWNKLQYTRTVSDRIREPALEIGSCKWLIHPSHEPWLINCCPYLEYFDHRLRETVRAQLNRSQSHLWRDTLKTNLSYPFSGTRGKWDHQDWKHEKMNSYDDLKRFWSLTSKNLLLNNQTIKRFLRII